MIQTETLRQNNRSGNGSGMFDMCVSLFVFSYQTKPAGLPALQ